MVVPVPQIRATDICHKYVPQIHATDTCHRYMPQIHATDTCSCDHAYRLRRRTVLGSCCYWRQRCCHQWRWPTNLPSTRMQSCCASGSYCFSTSSMMFCLAPPSMRFVESNPHKRPLSQILQSVILSNDFRCTKMPWNTTKVH